MSGLSTVGLTPPRVGGVDTNAPRRNLIKDLTTGRLVKLPADAEYNSNLSSEYVEAVHDTLPTLETRSSPSKGVGLFAVDDIPAYTRILEDYALLSLARGEDIPELWLKYSALPPEERKDFDQLGFSSNQLQKEEFLISKLEERGYDADEATKMVRAQSRFMANAFKEDNDKWRATLFLTVARINHSCTPNAQTHYRPASGAKVIYSLRDIKAGEEIEISYFGIHLSYEDRQKRAQSWGFTCTCPACSTKETPDGSKYEGILGLIRHSLEPSPKMGLGLRSAIDIAMKPEYPWLVAALPSLYFTLASSLEKKKEDTREERIAALESALKWECRITGPDSHFSHSRRRQLEKLQKELR